MWLRALRRPHHILLSAMVTLSGMAIAHDLDEILVTGRRDLVGEAVTASEGVVGQAEIATRALLRTGEMMEFVPGMVATQHSGSGKANQYFLRGFNLDHGTDFAVLVDHMPVNLRTHGHGQGYMDLNFLIPELIDRLAYRKGPYYAEVGDFSGAGSAHFSTRSAMDHHHLQATGGMDHYGRLLAAGSIGVADGELLYGLEGQRYDGPWTDIDEDLQKHNALLKYSRALGERRLSLTFMGYDSRWNSADQIPRRAVTEGLIGERGSLDTTLGGQSSRYSLSGAWESERWTLAAYAIDYDLKLWSNFTYFLEDPVNGDQFEQVDKRRLYGGMGRYQWDTAVAGRPMTHTLGLDVRLDVIDEVSLHQTAARSRLGPVRSDAVDQFSVGLYWQNEHYWSEKLRSTVGVRYDYYDFDVKPRVELNVHGVDLSANQGQRNDDLISLKAAFAYTLTEHWETYAAIGQGFHSNDARGTVTRVDPADGEAVAPVDPLVRSWGAEWGLRAHRAARTSASLTLWALRLDNELLFVGDAGGTEPSRKSRRHGAELAGWYRFNDIWTLDLEYAWTHARFAELDREDPGLDHRVPGAMEEILQAGITAQHPTGIYGSLRLRHFGPRPLEEDNSVRSGSSTVVNLLLGYQWKHFGLRAEVLNLLDSGDHDIDYFYASRLPGEPAAGVEDLHYHVMEPRTVRVSFSRYF